MAKNIKKKEGDIKAYRHEKDARKNVILVGLASYDISKPKPKKYEHDPHLDSQLKHNRTCNLIGNFKLLTSIHSISFKISNENRIAVKVIDHRGNEIMVLREIG